MSWSFIIQTTGFYNAAGHSVMNPYKLVFTMPDTVSSDDLVTCATRIVVEDVAWAHRTTLFFYVYGNDIGSFTYNLKTYQRQWNGSDYTETLVSNADATVNISGIQIFYQGCIISDLTEDTLGIFSSTPPAMLDARTSTTNGLDEATDYFNTPTAACMDVKIYTTGSDGNKIVTFKYGNIQNIPSGMYESSYLVRFGVNYTAAPDASIPITLLGIQQYHRPQAERFYQIGYIEALNRMGQTAGAYAIDNGRLIFFVQLFHHDDGDVIDATYIFGVDEDGSITDGTPPDTGGTVNIYTNTNPHDNDEYDDDDGSMDSETSGQELSVDNLLTTSYALTDAQLIAFGQWLWNNDLTAGLYAYQVSPIENILSCKRIPFDVASASDTYIWLGNLRSTVQAKYAETTHKQTITASPVQIPCYYNGDYMNMNNIISIYLPFVGIQSIPTSICYKSATETVTLPNGKTHKVKKMVSQYIKVEYIFDMIYGTCAALVYIGAYSDGVFSGVLQGAYNGTCGVDIPLTQSNRASNELALKKEGANTVAGVLTSVVSGAVSGSPGGVGGMLKGALMSGMMAGFAGGLRESNTKAGQETHFQTMGGFSSQVASFMPSNVMLFVEHFVYDEPDGYAHENGYPCNLCLNMEDICGYTELDGSIEISDIPCFEEERVLLKQALQEGFYL